MVRCRQSKTALPRVRGHRGRLERQGEEPVLDDLIELALELIFEGSLESARARQRPLWVRLASAGILLALFAGVTGLLVWAGISDQSWPLMALGLGVLALGTGLIVRLLQKRRRHRSPKDRS